MKSILWCSISILLVISGCSSSTPEPETSARLSSGSSSIYGNSQPMVRLDTTTSSFEQSWQLMHGNQIPVPVTPDINFKTTRVVTFFMGLRPNSGYGFSFTQDSKLEAGSLTVFVRLTEPASDAVVIPVQTSPFSSFSVNAANFKQVRVVNQASGQVIAVSEPTK